MLYPQNQLFKQVNILTFQTDRACFRNKFVQIGQPVQTHCEPQRQLKPKE